MVSSPRVPACTLLIALAALVAACGGARSGVADGIAVAAADSTCEVGRTTLGSGTHTFVVTNNGSQVTEVYVYGPGDEIMGEVENVGPGITRELTVELGGGEYEVACKPGQTGDGIRRALSVSGDAVAPDQTVAVTAIDMDFEGLDQFSATAGQTVAFTLTNAGAVEHEFEVLAPGGEPVGEVPPISPDTSATARITLDAPGTYTYVCRLADHEQQGMVGTFEVDER